MAEILLKLKLNINQSIMILNQIVQMLFLTSNRIVQKVLVVIIELSFGILLEI
jgi:hypothetical protein